MKSILYIRIISVVIITVAGTISSKAQNYRSRIDLLYKGIQNHLTDRKTGLYLETTDSVQKENPHSWLWPLCALIQATNETEALYPAKHYMQPVVKAIDQYYDATKPPVPGYQDYVMAERRSSRFYDDNEWIAIAYLDAYQRTHQPKYLSVSKEIYAFIKSGIDTVAGGGVYWKEGDKTSKNTCSNGPAVLVALQLYNVTHSKAYLDTAMSIYRWTNKHLQAPEGTYYDNIGLPSLKIAKQQYTYNTGCMLQANVMLYHITHDKRYLVEAERIATAGKALFFKNGRLPNEYWFNAVLFRGYIELYKVDRNADWIQIFKTDAENIWQTERDQNNMLGKKPAKRLIDQAAMIEIYARLAQMRKKGKM